MSLTTDQIIAKFGEVYPTVEGAMTANNALYKAGLDDIERLYNDWNITGSDKAKFVANYVGNSTAQMINAAMQVSISLVEKAYALPIEAEYKEAQTSVLKNSENLNALIKSFQAVCDMAGSMGSGGIVATPAMLASMRLSLWKMFSILKDPETGTPLFTGTPPDEVMDWTYLGSLLSKQAFGTDGKDVNATPDKMGEANNTNPKK